MKYTLDSELFYEGVFYSEHKFNNIKVTSPRTIEYYELEIFTQAGGTTFINGKPQALRRGLCVCAKPGELRYSELPLNCHYVKISPEMTDICRLLDTFPTYSYTRDEETYVSLINCMINAANSDNTELRLAKFMEFISILCENNKNLVLHDANDRTRGAIETSLDYLETHFAEKCSLDEIARQTYLSPIYLHGLFKATIGKTPHEYLVSLRINKAKTLLLTEQLSMADISAKCGFSSQSHFNTVFKKETGMSPNMFKKKHIEKYSY